VKKKKKQQKHQHPKKRKQQKPVTSTAIVPVPPPTVVPQSLSVIPKIKQTIENLERIRRFVSQCLNVDLQVAERKAKEAGKELPDEIRKRLEIDWGTIPGVDKPFLMQPGAEKMMKWLQLRPKFHTREVEHSNGHLEVISHVTLYSLITGEEVFEGPDASCTTMETNYRYTWAEAADPGDDEKDRLKLINMGRNRKVWKRIRGQNQEVWVWQLRVENPNIHNERNKVRQIGQKRGLVKCLRQMGAISAIFNSDPSEWNIGDESDDELEMEQDYTPEGRRILIEGRSPSGKYVSSEAQREQAKRNQQSVLDGKLSENAPHGHPPGSQGAKNAEAALKRVEEEDERLQEAKNVTPKPSVAIPAPKAAQQPPVAQDQPSNGVIELDWTQPEQPIVRGDIGEILDGMQKIVSMAHVDGWWHFVPKEAPMLRAYSLKLGYKIIEIAPKKPSGKQEAKPEPKKASAGAGAKQPSAGPELLCGTLHNVTVGQASNKSPFLTLKINGEIHYCWVTTLHDFLLNKRYPLTVEVWIDKRKQVVGLKRVGTVHFDEDGRTPVVQRKEQEVGAKTLFGT
jgi:hypothetical protein